MKKDKKNHPELLPQYDFRAGMRGKYAKRYARGTNIIILEPDLAKVFPNSKSVNHALRTLTKAWRRQSRKA